MLSVCMMNVGFEAAQNCIIQKPRRVVYKSMAINLVTGSS